MKAKAGLMNCIGVSREIKVGNEIVAIFPESTDLEAFIKEDTPIPCTVAIVKNNDVPCDNALDNFYDNGESNFKSTIKVYVI